MNLLVGPKEARIEVDTLSRSPVCVRPAYRTNDFSEPFDAFKEWLVDRLPEHILDLRPVRRAYRIMRWAARRVDMVLFDGAHDDVIERYGLIVIGLMALGILALVLR